MSTTIPLQSVNIVLQMLQDSVDEWVSEGHSVDGIYIVLLSGLSINLGDIKVPAITAFNGIRIVIDDIYVNIPKVFLDIAFPQFAFLWDSGNSILNTPIPSSEHWEYGGPLRGNQWPPKVGTDFSPVEYYRLWHVGLDASSIILVVSIAYALNKIGLSKVTDKLVSRALTNNSAVPNNEISDIKDNTDELVNALIDQSSADWLAKGSQFAGIVGVVNSIIANGINVYAKMTDNGTTNNLLKDLQTELEESMNSLQSWLTYLDQFSLWLANPIGNERPVRPV